MRWRSLHPVGWALLITATVVALTATALMAFVYLSRFTVTDEPAAADASSLVTPPGWAVGGRHSCDGSHCTITEVTVTGPATASPGLTETITGDLRNAGWTLTRQSTTAGDAYIEV